MEQTGLRNGLNLSCGWPPRTPSSCLAIGSPMPQRFEELSQLSPTEAVLEVEARDPSPLPSLPLCWSCLILALCDFFLLSRLESQLSSPVHPRRLSNCRRKSAEFSSSMKRKRRTGLNRSVTMTPDPPATFEFLFVFVFLRESLTCCTHVKGL